MAEQKISSLSWKEQKIIKPMIEDVIYECLEGDIKKTALDFSAYLRENKIKPVLSTTNRWKGVYKGTPIYYIGLCDRTPPYFRFPTDEQWIEESKPIWCWIVTPCLYHFNQYEESVIDKGWQDFICDNLKKCRFCYPKCGSINGINKKVLGKETNAICHCSLANGGICADFINPDEMMVGHIKWLMDLEKNARTQVNI